MSAKATGLRARLADRARYGSNRAWLLGLYDRVCRRLPWAPGRGRMVRVRTPGAGRERAGLRLGTSDFLVYEEIYVHDEYESSLARIEAPVSFVLDLGANVGLSLIRWRQAFPGARIVGVEADESNFGVCRRNLPDDRAEVIHACVTDRNGRVRLDKSAMHWAYRIDREHSPSAAADGSVEAVTMEALLARVGAPATIDLLKCDIEGAEADVFRDCASWIERVRNLIVEAHAPYTGEDLLRDIERCGGRFEAETVSKGRDHAVLSLRALG